MNNTEQTIAVPETLEEYDKDFAPIDDEENTPHPHAAAMIQYGYDAKTTEHPWELWEIRKAKKDWKPHYDRHPSWGKKIDYRKKDGSYESIVQIASRPQPHHHAAAMMEYAKDAATIERPWNLWEAYQIASGVWETLTYQPDWSNYTSYRRKDRSFESMSKE